MNLGYSTWGMPQVPIDRGLAHLARLGFQGVELAVIPGYTTELGRLDTAERRRIRQLLHRHGLDLAAIAAHTSLLEPDESKHSANVDRLTRALDLAVDLADGPAPPVVNTTSGGRSGEWEAMRQTLVDRLGGLVDRAARLGVTLGIEPHVGACLDLPDRALQLLREVNSPYLKINFDISHFDVIGLTIEETVPLLAPQTVHTHVKDQRGRHPEFEFLIPGEGDFDYVRYLKAMRQAGYDGYITVEVSVMVQRRPGYDPYAAAALSFKTLSEAFERAGIEQGCHIRKKDVD